MTSEPDPAAPPSSGELAPAIARPALFALTYGYIGSYAHTLYTLVAVSIVALGALAVAARRAASRAPVYA